MTEYAPHAHAYFRVRAPRLVAVLALLHLPYGWLIQSGDLPHSPECTERFAVLTEDDT